MNNLLTKWWSPFITHFVLFVLGGAILPLFIFSITNSRSLLLALILVSGIISPFLLAKLHGISLRVPLIVGALVTICIFSTWPNEQIGNWKLQIAEHVLSWIIAATTINSSIEAISLKRCYQFSKEKTNLL